MDPVVSTRYGRVRGSVAGGVATFKGIPYAAPPFGANRLQPPRPVEPWSGVRDALTYGPKSPQLPYPPPIDVLIPELAGPGEDCLNLNIWSPDLGPVALPVMVWIPGGMFQYHGTGASPWYDGSRFARDGVICVTINYRVAADGFLYVGDGVANLGLLNQVAALEWVHENIAAWVAFASRGDGGWPKYDLSRRATMRFDTTSQVVDDPQSAERAVWAGVR